MTPLDELALLLRPCGGDLFLLSTGRDEQIAPQCKLYGIDTLTPAAAVEEAIHAAFVARLAGIAERVVDAGSSPASLTEHPESLRPGLVSAYRACSVYLIDIHFFCNPVR